MGAFHYVLDRLFFGGFRTSMCVVKPNDVHPLLEGESEMWVTLPHTNDASSARRNLGSGSSQLQNFSTFLSFLLYPFGISEREDEPRIVLIIQVLLKPGPRRRVLKLYIQRDDLWLQLFFIRIFISKEITKSFTKSENRLKIDVWNRNLKIFGGHSGWALIKYNEKWVAMTEQNRVWQWNLFSCFF